MPNELQELPQNVLILYLEMLIKQELDRQSAILLARAYHAGVQPVYLTDRQKEFLDIHSDNQFCLNICRTVTNTLRDELTVIGFETSEADTDSDAGAGKTTQANYFWDLLNNKNKMDELQGTLHEMALRDGEAFILLDYDEDKKYTTIVIHERFTDSAADAWKGTWDSLLPDTQAVMTGNGQGVWMVYENDDPNQEPTAAVQQWKETIYDEVTEKFNVRDRRTVYYPDEIVRFYQNNGRWVLLDDEGITNPQEWKDSKGQPLGIPVIHFKNPGLMPEAWDAIPPQDAINKMWVDVLGTGDLAGFPFFVLLGLYPTTDGKAPDSDGSNVWSVGPAQFLGNANSKEGASVEKFEGSDPTPLMNVVKDQVMFVANITGTPANRFVTTAQIASAETLKEQDKELKKRAGIRKTLFGNAWERVLVMMRRLENKFGGKSFDESVTFSVLWQSSISNDDLLTAQTLGVPDESLWLQMFPREQVEKMKETMEYKLKVEKLFWEAYNVASQSGESPASFALRMGFTQEEVNRRFPSDTIPQTDI